MTQEQTERVIADLGMPDQAIQSDELPWVPQGERVWFKPLRFDLSTGRWINVLKDDLIYQDDVFSKLERYLEFCDERNIEPQDLRY